MPARVRPYLFYDVAVSICAVCLQPAEGKIVFENERVYLDKRCRAHGRARVMIADDIEYYRKAREVYIKPAEMPERFGTPVRWGCPYDCGLCADHQQHSCLTLIEVGDRCNLECPICYAESSPHRPLMRPLAQIERMLDALVKAEGEPDVVQISGGEPTIHPEFFAILDAARRRPIRHLMVNTNGVRIARDPGFAEHLASYMPAFEIYLQFDSLRERSLVALRGEDLRDVRLRALDRLDELGLSTTLVVTLQRGLNDKEIGEILDFAISRPCVRGVTFQPVQAAGRLQGHDPERDRLTLTEVRRAILEQSRVFAPEDIVPVPCHPDCLAMAYGIRNEGGVTPLTRYVDPATLIDGARNTIVFERDPRMRELFERLFSTAASPARGAEALAELLCCLPRISAPSSIGYADIFRVIIMEFLDAHSFDVRSVKRSCVHIVHPEDGRIIPFDTYNLFYRDQKESEILAPIRARLERSWQA